MLLRQGATLRSSTRETLALTLSFSFSFQNEVDAMITRETATRIAYVAAEQAMRRPISIRPELTIEREFCWVFFYDSAEYVANGNDSAKLFGNAPIIVNGNTGKASMTGTNHPIEAYLAAYEALGSERFDRGEWREFLRVKG